MHTNLSELTIQRIKSLLCFNTIEDARVHVALKEYQQDVRPYYVHCRVEVFVILMQYALFMVSTKRFIFHLIELIAWTHSYCGLHLRIIINNNVVKHKSKKHGLTHTHIGRRLAKCLILLTPADTEPTLPLVKVKDISSQIWYEQKVVTTA